MKPGKFYFMHYSKPFYCNIAQSEPPTKPAAWTRDSEKVARRLRRWKEKKWYNKDVEAFALSKAFIDMDPDEDDKWEVCVAFSVAASGQR
jgi:hypothetical protein